MTTVIRRTKIGTTEIVTVKTDDPFTLNPFATYVMTDDICTHIRHFTSAETALHHHDYLIEKITKQEGRASDQAK
jgi:hypothetical protein